MRAWPTTWGAGSERLMQRTPPAHTQLRRGGTSEVQIKTFEDAGPDLRETGLALRWAPAVAAWCKPSWVHWTLCCSLRAERERGCEVCSSSPLLVRPELASEATLTLCTPIGPLPGADEPSTPPQLFHQLPPPHTPRQLSAPRLSSRPSSCPPPH